MPGGKHLLEEAQAELVHGFEMIRDEYQEAGQELPEDVEVAVRHGLSEVVCAGNSDRID